MINAEHRIIYGSGCTQEKAALNFLNDFQKKFPQEIGVYDFFMRAPITFELEHALTAPTEYLYRMCCSFMLKENLDDINKKNSF